MHKSSLELALGSLTAFSFLTSGYQLSNDHSHTIPALAQYHQDVHLQQVLDVIRKTPDFVIMSQNKKDVFFVEVKYRANRHAEDLLHIADDLNKRWHPSWLFIASPDGFYFDSCTNIILKKGEIPPLGTTWVATEIQEKYRLLLNDFLSPRP